MFKWISRNYRDEKRKAEQEAELKQSLAAKVQRFQAAAPSAVTDAYTAVTISGKKVRVPREHITIEALSPITSDNPTWLTQAD